MSIYCDKCDFADVFEMHGEDYMKRSKIYVGNQTIVPLRIDSYKDAVPYFPYIVGASGSDKESGSFFLTSESYVDRQEREHLQWILDRLMAYYRKCKRKKVEYTVEEALKTVLLFEGEKDTNAEILANEILEKGNKAKIPYYCHTKMADYYRKNLCDEMIRVGYPERKAKEWCYGWERVFYGDTD